MLTLPLLAIVGHRRHGCVDRLSLQRIPALAGLPQNVFGTGRGTTWLLVGSDSRQGRAPSTVELATGGDIGNGCTDDDPDVHVPARSMSPTMVSISRDSWRAHPGHAEMQDQRGFLLGGASCWRVSSNVEWSASDHYAGDRVRSISRPSSTPSAWVTMCPPEPITCPAPATTCPPVANASTYATRSDTCAPGRRRAQTSTAWSTSACSCPRCCTGRPARRGIPAQLAALVSDGRSRRRNGHGRPRRPHLDLAHWSGTCTVILRTTIAPIEFPLERFRLVSDRSDAAGRLFAALAADDLAPPDTLNTQ